MNDLPTLKTAYVRRIGGNLYDITYSDCRDMDRCVPYSYVQRIEASGYRIEYV